MSTKEAAIVVCACIGGSAIGVFICWAMTHRFILPTSSSSLESGDFSQAQYMREVRMRHQDDLAASLGGKRALVSDDAASTGALGTRTRTDIPQEHARYTAQYKQSWGGESQHS